MALRVKKSLIPGAGKGLFTTASIKKGETVIEYLGDIINAAEYNQRVRSGKDGYTLTIHRNLFIDAYATPEHKARYANDAAGIRRVHGLSNNSEYWIMGRDRAFIVATRNIKAGEEIFCNYTKSYWDAVRYNMKRRAK